LNVVVITNISGDDLRKLGYEVGQNVRLTLGTSELTLPFVRGFNDVAVMKPLLYIDSRRGRLGLAINEGDFAKTYGAPPRPIFIPKKQ
jgi:S-adenosylmethionine hydrolase